MTSDPYEPLPVMPYQPISLLISGLTQEYSRRKAVQQQESAAARQELSGLISDGDAARERLGGRFEFDVQGMFNDPAYKSELAEGLKELENALAGGGIRRSSTGGKATSRFLQSILGAQTDRYFSRQLATAEHDRGNDRQLAGLGANAQTQLAAGQRGIGTGISRLIDRGLNSAQTFSSIFEHFADKKAAKDKKPFSSIFDNLKE